MQIYFIVALVLLIVGLSIFAFYRRKFQRWWIHSMVRGMIFFPPRVRVAGVPEPAKSTDSRLEQRNKTFQEMGFEFLGCYKVWEWNEHFMWVWLSRKTGLIGIVNSRAGLGTWTDVWLAENAGEEIVCLSNIYNFFHYYFLPGDRKSHHPNASEKELVETALKARDPRLEPPLPSPENWPDWFEKAHQRRADFLLLNPPDEAEVRRLLRENPSGKDYLDWLDKNFELLQTCLKQSIEEQLRRACLHDFVKSSKMPAALWQQSSQRMLVIHDRFPLNRLLDKQAEAAFLTPSARNFVRKRQSRNKNPREAFAQFNNQQAPSQRYKKMGSVEKPIPADIYRGPLDTPST